MSKQLFDNIKKLCAIDGISGRENEVSAEIVSQIEDYADSVEIDALGNVIAFKKGKKSPKNKIMLAAHMDEVGFIVTSITDEGYIRFATVGGINSKVIVGRKVTVGDKKKVGVIGTLPIHQTSAADRSKAVDASKLLIDIGAKNREEAEKYIKIGDSACFDDKYTELGKNSLMAKALDDRIGCAVMIEIIKSELQFDTWFAFTVQEEVGLRGATVASHTISPDVAIVIETTASGDVAGVKDEKRVTVVGGGAVVSYMDRSTIYNKKLYDLAFDVASKKKIKVQTKTMIAGGNDAGAIHVSGSGVRTIAISVASKYIHSASCVVDKDDVEAVYKLTKELTAVIGDC